MAQLHVDQVCNRIYSGNVWSTDPGVCDSITYLWTHLQSSSAAGRLFIFNSAAISLNFFFMHSKVLRELIIFLATF